MNRIILIGNGFDLAHGLKTSYKDFIDDFWMNKFLLVCDALNEKTPNSYTDEDISVNTSQSISEAIDGETWFEIFKSSITYSKQGGNPNSYKINNLFLKRISDKSANWVDIEAEYYSALNDCSEGKIKLYKEVGKPYRPYGIKDLNNEFSRIQEALKKYLKTQTVSWNYYYNNDFSKKMMEKIYYPLKENGEFVKSEEKWENILFLNFNFTDTTKLYFQEHKTAKLIHIHGELDYSENSKTHENPENPIIFGYGDERDNKYKSIEDKNDNNYLKNIKQHKYKQATNYDNLMDFINSDFYEIFIMGHSCGLSDRTLLSKLFEHGNCRRIKPFFYQKGAENDYEDKLMNISRIFLNKDKYDDRIKGNDCEPLPQIKK